jgi:hypothetical protein
MKSQRLEYCACPLPSNVRWQAFDSTRDSGKQGIDRDRRTGSRGNSDFYSMDRNYVLPTLITGYDTSSGLAIPAYPAHETNCSCSHHKPAQTPHVRALSATRARCYVYAATPLFRRDDARVRVFPVTDGPRGLSFFLFPILRYARRTAGRCHPLRSPSSLRRKTSYKASPRRQYWWQYLGPPKLCMPGYHRRLRYCPRPCIGNL